MRRHRPWFGFVSLCLSIASIAACGSNPATTAGSPCAVDADCGASGKCQNQRCEDPSASSGAPNLGTGGASSSGISVGAGNPGSGSGPNVDYCKGSGPPILVGDNMMSGTAGTCSGDVAETTFRYALCSCTDYVASTPLTTDSFDSSKGPYNKGDNGGSVGINGRTVSNGTMTIGGSLWVGDPQGFQAGGSPTKVEGELHDNGPLRSGASVEIAHDALVGGDIQVDALTVGGALTIPSTAAVDIKKPAGALQKKTAPVSVPLPCACADKDLVDIAGYVSHYAHENDNAKISLSPDAYANYAGETTLTLPCGMFYLSGIAGQGNFKIEVQGRTALFIGKDIVPGGELTVELASGGELDLFIAGTIVSSQPIHFGSAAAPARVRVYVGGTGTIQLSAASLFAGNLYAPRAELVTSGGAEIFGSVFVRRVAASNDLTIHYDTAVLKAGEGCGGGGGSSSGHTCTSCEDCGNQACVGEPSGTCGACTDSSQCCSPLSCVDGLCQAAIPK